MLLTDCTQLYSVVSTKTQVKRVKKACNVIRLTCITRARVTRRTGAKVRTGDLLFCVEEGRVDDVNFGRARMRGKGQC